MKQQRATATSWPIKPMPAEHKTVALDGAYSPDEMVTISFGLIPRSLADKWFIYLDGEWLNFHRSRTGTCVYQLQLTAVDGGYQAGQARLNRDTAQYRSTDDAYDVAMIGYLIDRLLLKRFVPLPTPKGLRDEDKGRYRQDMIGRSKGDGSIDLPLANGN